VSSSWTGPRRGCVRAKAGAHPASESLLPGWVESLGLPWEARWALIPPIRPSSGREPFYYQEKESRAPWLPLQAKQATVRHASF